MLSRQRGQSPELHSKRPTARACFPLYLYPWHPFELIIFFRYCVAIFLFFIGLTICCRLEIFVLCLVEERSTMVGLIGGTMASASSSSTSSICCSSCSWLWASVCTLEDMLVQSSGVTSSFLLDSVASVWVSVVHMVVEASSVHTILASKYLE